MREIILYEGLQKIGDGAFPGCISLQSIKLPSTVTEIGDHAFNGCWYLREVTLNEGLQKIGEDTFRGCSSLESVTLPSTVVDIDDDAFRDCRRLREVLLNDRLQKIGDNAFCNCVSLENIKLPTTLVEIGKHAFRSCSNLEEVELNGVPQRLKNTAFYNCGALERFVFPDMSYRLVNIIQTNHWEEVEDKLNEVRGVVRWDSVVHSDELFVSTPTQRNWDEMRRDFGKITRLISFYELKEATSTFELALWKSKLDQADATNTTNRAAYRMDVPGPVKDTMLKYLNHI